MRLYKPLKKQISIKLDALIGNWRVVQKTAVGTNQMNSYLRKVYDLTLGNRNYTANKTCITIKIGYARVSTYEQNLLPSQEQQLKSEGCTKIY